MLKDKKLRESIDDNMAEAEKEKWRRHLRDTERQKQIKQEIYQGNIKRSDQIAAVKARNAEKDRMFLEQTQAEEEADKWMEEDKKNEKLKQQ
jgi:hypothetical protein